MCGGWWFPHSVTRGNIFDTWCSYHDWFHWILYLSSMVGSYSMANQWVQGALLAPSGPHCLVTTQSQVEITDRLTRVHITVSVLFVCDYLTTGVLSCGLPTCPWSGALVTVFLYYATPRAPTYNTHLQHSFYCWMYYCGTHSGYSPCT